MEIQYDSEVLQLVSDDHRLRRLLCYCPIPGPDQRDHNKLGPQSVHRRDVSLHTAWCKEWNPGDIQLFPKRFVLEWILRQTVKFQEQHTEEDLQMQVWS